MSKSSGEFLTLSLLEEKGYDPMVYRLFCLGSHYRKSLVFSWEGMDSTKTAYQKLVARIAALDPEDKTEADPSAVGELKARFAAAMDNDLNTALAVTALYDVLKAKIGDAAKLALIADFDTVLSLNLIPAAQKAREAAKQTEKQTENAAQDGLAVVCLTEGLDDSFTAEVEALIRERADAKKKKDFAEADKIRAHLSEMGVTLKDGKGSVSWEKA